MAKIDWKLLAVGILLLLGGIAVGYGMSVYPELFAGAGWVPGGYLLPLILIFLGIILIAVSYRSAPKQKSTHTSDS